MGDVPSELSVKGRQGFTRLAVSPGAFQAEGMVVAESKGRA